MIREYIAYLKDNPQGYWFRAKVYGWGWTPAKWQGWLVLAVYVAGVFLFASTIDDDSLGKEVVFTFILPVALLTAAMIRVCWRTGERPHWQWGLPDDDGRDKMKS